MGDMWSWKDNGGYGVMEGLGQGKVDIKDVDGDMKGHGRSWGAWRDGRTWRDKRDGWEFGGTMGGKVGTEGSTEGPCWSGGAVTG